MCKIKIASSGARYYGIPVDFWAFTWDFLSPQEMYRFSGLFICNVDDNFDVYVSIIDNCGSVSRRIWGGR